MYWRREKRNLFPAPAPRLHRHSPRRHEQKPAPPGRYGCVRFHPAPPLPLHGTTLPFQVLEAGGLKTRGFSQGGSRLQAAPEGTTDWCNKVQAAEPLGQCQCLLAPKTAEWQIVINTTGNNLIGFGNGVSVPHNEQLGGMVALNQKRIFLRIAIVLVDKGGQCGHTPLFLVIVARGESCRAERSYTQRFQHEHT